MTRFMTPTRAAVRAVLPVLGTLLAAAVLLLDACPAQAFTPTSKSSGESTPLNFSTSSGGGSHTSTGGASIVRTIVGLLIVIAVIWGLTWILKQVKSSRDTRSAGTGLSSLATLALGSGRTLHLVRAGRDYLLVGSAEHGVAPIHRYTEDQAREVGLHELLAEQGDDDGETGTGTGRPRSLEIPGQARPRIPGAGVPLLDRLREWTVRR
ncbi:MAG TPA: flagellar biosynthetic protein FliO [Solirubrobacteraceae bacterium]|jgi:flagellar protein FliO/FliZ|nr:flagellar biosynthetic protein FliO [Solirubrobacteraceae bacterium]